MLSSKKKHEIKFCNNGQFFSAALERFNLQLNAKSKEGNSTHGDKNLSSSFAKSTSFKCIKYLALENESFSNGSTKID